MPKKSTRDNILQAANLLFYNEGIRTVSVDAIAEKAGITKKSLYYHFKSKDELIEAYLELRDTPGLIFFQKSYEDASGPLDKKIGAIFKELSILADQPSWKGCGFLRTAAELVNLPGHPAIKVGVAHKIKFETWLSDIFLEQNIKNASTLARQVALLMDGALSAMLIHKDPNYIITAGLAAEDLVLKNSV